MARILIVDDSPTDTHVLKTLLERNQHEGLTADTGEEAIAKVKEIKPDLILMDVVLPSIGSHWIARCLIGWPGGACPAISADA